MKGKKEARALELTKQEAALLHGALEAFVLSGEFEMRPNEKAELRVLSKRARELAK